VQSIPLKRNDSGIASRPLILGLIALVLFVYAYKDTFLWLVERYDNPDSHYSHGYLIPFITGWIIWQKKTELRTLQATGTVYGLYIVTLALLVHIASVWTHTFFTSGFSILLLVVGTSLYLYGVPLTRRIAFPLAFLGFMFPLPMRVISAVSFPLKMLVAKLGVTSMELSGMPILQEGAVIHLPNASLTVGDPCSGIRSLIALLAMGSLIAYMSRLSLAKKTVLFLLAIPIAIFTNVLRVCALILAANSLGSEWASPEHWFHLTSGMAVFVISMALIFLSMKVLEWKPQEKS
jgi:exosortase A